MKAIQFKLNLPADVKAWLEQEAVRNLRSQGAQVVTCLRAAMLRQQAEGEGVEK
ncbi:MAG: Arc family DNA-binding protein [Sulfitobacter sp.]|uniref:DNA-binding protein n=1 Tax=Celeribacter marinus TaxID=1397108 RepID=UPI003176EDC5